MTHSAQDNEKDKTRKTIYKETEEREEKPDEGQSSSVADLSKTDLISKPERANKPLGSSHEPGTTPGS